jgi:RNA polymerase sigma factor (sigma-70 family)
MELEAVRSAFAKASSRLRKVFIQKRTFEMELEIVQEEEIQQESEIIKRVLDGATDEFCHLVTAHQNLVYGMIFRQVRNSEIAEELAQDVFTKAFLALKQFKHQAKFSTWLTRIALNTTSSYFSSKRYKQSQKNVPLENWNEQAGFIDGSLIEFQLSHLHRFLGDLKPNFREVVILCGLEGRTYQEASEIIGVPKGTICSRMNTALNHLRKKFRQLKQ